MKIFILKNNLKNGLTIIERIAAKSLTLPVLANTLLTVEKNFLKLSATDLEIAVNYWILGKMEKEGAIQIPARLFSQFLSLLPDEKITIEEKNQILFLQGEYSKTQIKGQEIKEFPIIPQIKKEKFFQVSLPSFCQGLSQVIDHISLLQNRPEISGVYFNLTPIKLTLAATDTFRLAEKTISLQELENNLEKGEEFSFIVPPKIIREIIAIFTGKEGIITGFLSPNQVLFEYVSPETGKPQIQLLSRLIEGEFPHYEDVIPKSFDVSITLPKNEFLNQIKLASLFAPKTNEITLRVSPQDKRVEIKAQNPDTGEHSSFLSAEVKGEQKNQMDFDFNWKFIVAGLSNITSQEVILELNKNDRPAVIRPVGDPSYLYLAMPIRTA